MTRSMRKRRRHSKEKGKVTEETVVITITASTYVSQCLSSVCNLSNNVFVIHTETNSEAWFFKYLWNFHTTVNSRITGNRRFQLRSKRKKLSEKISSVTVTWQQACALQYENIWNLICREGRGLLLGSRHKFAYCPQPQPRSANAACLSDSRLCRLRAGSLETGAVRAWDARLSLPLSLPFSHPLRIPRLPPSPLQLPPQPAGQHGSSNRCFDKCFRHNVTGNPPACQKC